jgi:steroid 5-alpha reductase family enzyme
MKTNHIINLQKGLTIFFILFLIFRYHQIDNPTAWVYLGLHGSYGIFWNIKSKFFPDRQWEKPTSLIFAIVGFASLCLYWVAPWLLTSRGVIDPPWCLALCITIYILGIIFHLGADLQKYVALSYQPEHLIKNGFWSLSRNPNYFGEFLIYISFALLAMHWLPFLILGVWVTFYWLPNMRKKDRSLSRYPDFAEYRLTTKFFVPFLF